jgi:hypothetical protein
MLSEKDKLSLLIAILAAGYMADGQCQPDRVPVDKLANLAERIQDEAFNRADELE